VKVTRECTIPVDRTTVPVSVILPFFNGQPFASEALDSVLFQTRPPSEVVVIDDGSGPLGTAFLEEYFDRTTSIVAHGESRGGSVSVTVLRSPRRRGPGPARNRGIEASREPLIAFQDADDLWEPEKLEKQVGLMEAWPELDACHTDAVLFNERGEEFRRPRVALALEVDLALRAAPMATPSIVVRRDAIERLGHFDERLFCSQDWDLQVRMALGGFQVQRIPEPLVRVRREGHGHHSGHWRRYLMGHWRVIWKHRSAYLQRGGIPALLFQAAVEMRVAGLKKGGPLGALLQVPASRFGVGND